MNPCDTCPGKACGMPAPIRLRKGERVNIHFHREGHHARVQVGLMAFYMTGTKWDGGMGDFEGEPFAIKEAGESLWIPAGARHGAEALEDSEMLCDFGPNARPEDAELRYA